MSEKFEIKFKCNNCGHEFTKTFDKGTLVKERYRPDLRGVVYGEEGTVGELKKEGSVKCENCNTMSQIIKVP